MTSILMVLLAELEFVFAVIHDSANRRSCSGSDFHEVVTALLGLAQRVGRGEDPQLLSFRTDDSNLSHSNFAVHAQFGDDNPPLNVLVVAPAARA